LMIKITGNASLRKHPSFAWDNEVGTFVDCLLTIVALIV